MTNKYLLILSIVFTTIRIDAAVTTLQEAQQKLTALTQEVKKLQQNQPTLTKDISGLGASATNLQQATAQEIKQLQTQASGKELQAQQEFIAGVNQLDSEFQALKTEQNKIATQLQSTNQQIKALQYELQPKSTLEEVD